MKTKMIIGKTAISIVFSIVVISFIIISGNYYEIYLGKKYGKDIISRLE